jgi:OOP family OmpA-OmpF porin
MNFIQRMSPLLALLLLNLVFSNAAFALESTGFKDTDALVEQADELNAEILAPKSFGSAAKYYASARKSTASGNTQTARKYLVKANTSLRKAIEASKVAARTFESTLKARDRAVTAQAAAYEPALWQKAETELINGARNLEIGNSKSANNYSIKAGKSYGVAELAAIKTGIVGNARVLIAEAEADRNKVTRNAPITLAQAKSLVAQAEATLDSSRYDTDEPKAMAAEAEYQTKHAMYIASQIAMLNARQLSGEELILKWEKPLRDLAGVLAVTTDMTGGFAAASEASLVQANRLMAQNVEKNARISALEVELDDTEMVVEEAEQAQRQLTEVESLFNRYEARVLLEGNNIILRLVGLSFPTGQASIETQYFSLLTAVKKSIKVFPGSYVVIEGHTDAQGDETKNLVLSQERANSVRAYLIANSSVPATRISAEGYGESRPVATNMYDHGRAQNRRIDIVLKGAWSGNQTARVNR